jgi:hypothetical protein
VLQRLKGGERERGFPVAATQLDSFNFKELHPFLLLIVHKLNDYLFKHNSVLFIIYNYMFRPISGHPQVQNWSLKRIKEALFLRPIVKLRMTCDGRNM